MLIPAYRADAISVFALLQSQFKREFTMQSQTFNITGMTCGVCISNVTRALVAINGVAHVNVSLTTGLAEVQYDELVTSVDALKLAVSDAGYGVCKTNITQKLH